MNRPLAHLLGWASLVIGAAVIAAIVLTPPWLDLHYTQWERGFIEACARTQQEQVEAYEHFASALTSNDPVLLQRLAYHHLRLKPSHTDFVSLPARERGEADFFVSSDNGAPPHFLSGRPTKTTLIESWLHKPYPVVGIDYPPYEAPDSLFIRLATGPRRLVLLGLGGVFLLCGLILPGPGQAATGPVSERLMAWRKPVEPKAEQEVESTIKPPGEEPLDPDAPIQAPLAVALTKPLSDAAAAPVVAMVPAAIAPQPISAEPDPTVSPATEPASDPVPVIAARADPADEEFVSAVIDEDEPVGTDQVEGKTDEDEEHPAIA